MCRWCNEVVGRMKQAGLDVPLVVGGIIPPEDAAELEKAGVAAVYTPKDFELNRIMSDLVRIVEGKAKARVIRFSLPAVISSLTQQSVLTLQAVRVRLGFLHGVSSWMPR